MPLHERLRAAREARKLTYYAASHRMRGVNQQQLINLERGPGARRKTDSKKITIHVAAEIVIAYWPDVQLEHFLDDPDPDGTKTPLRFAPRDSNASRRLKGFAPTG